MAHELIADAVIPTIDLRDKNSAFAVCSSIRRWNCAIVTDGKYDAALRLAYILEMAQYYRQPVSMLLHDVFKELFYQIGITPPFIEATGLTPADFAHLLPEDQPTWPIGGFEAYIGDEKMRLFHSIGRPPAQTNYPNLNMRHSVPDGVKPLVYVLDPMGERLREVGLTMLERLAEGLGWFSDTFTKLLDAGSHLVAPTGTIVHNTFPLIAAAAHKDCNFLSVHDSANCGGLYIWAGGKKMRVRIPAGYYLVQTGLQLEYMLGGESTAGEHEVVIRKAEAVQLHNWFVAHEGSVSSKAVRVSATLFLTQNTDSEMRPLHQFATLERCARYPTTEAGAWFTAYLEKLYVAGQVRAARGLVAPEWV